MFGGELAIPGCCLLVPLDRDEFGVEHGNPKAIPADLLCLISWEIRKHTKKKCEM